MSIPKLESLHEAVPEISYLQIAQENKQRLFQKALASPDPRFSASTIAKRANLYLEDEDTRGASQALDLKVKNDSLSEHLINTYIKLAEFHGQTGNKDQALSVLQKATALVPQVELDRDGFNQSNCYGNLAIACARLGEAEMAVQVLGNLPDNNSLKTFKDNQLFHIVSILARHGQIETALSILEQNGLEKDKDWFWGNLAVDYSKKGDFALWEKAVDQISSPETTLISYSYFMGAKYYLEHNNPEKAREWLILANQKINDLKDVHPHKTASQDEYIKFALQELKDPQMALQIAKTMDTTLFTAYSYVDIAKALFKQEDQQTALEVLNTAKQILAALSNKAPSPYEISHYAKAILDLAGCLWEFGFQEEGNQMLAEMALTDKNLCNAVDGLSQRGNFRLALHLSNTLSGKIKGARLGGITQGMSKRGMADQAIPILEEEASLAIAHVQSQNQDLEAYTKAARDSSYSLESIARTYFQLGRPTEAQAILEQLFQFLLSTKDHPNKYWYQNVMDACAYHAIQVGDFGLALRVAQEIPSPKIYINIAEGLITAGQIDQALKFLGLAEKIVNKLPKKKFNKSDYYLMIANMYYFLEKRLLTV